MTTLCLIRLDGVLPALRRFPGAGLKAASKPVSTIKTFGEVDERSLAQLRRCMERGDAEFGVQQFLQGSELGVGLSARRRDDDHKSRQHFQAIW